MTINVVWQGLEPSPVARRALEACERPLQRFFHRVLRADWALRPERGGVVVTCRVHAVSGSYRAQARERSAAEAVRVAFERVLAQRQRRKGARQARRRRAPARG